MRESENHRLSPSDNDLSYARVGRGRGNPRLGCMSQYSVHPVSFSFLEILPYPGESYSSLARRSTSSLWPCYALSSPGTWLDVANIVCDCDSHLLLSRHPGIILEQEVWSRIPRYLLLLYHLSFWLQPCHSLGVTWGFLGS